MCRLWKGPNGLFWKSFPFRKMFPVWFFSPLCHILFCCCCWDHLLFVAVLKPAAHRIQKLVPIWWTQCTFYFCLENRVDFFFVHSFVCWFKLEFFRRHSWRSVHGSSKSHTFNLPSKQLILYFTFSTFWYYFFPFFLVSTLKYFTRQKQ